MSLDNIDSVKDFLFLGPVASDLQDIVRVVLKHRKKGIGYSYVPIIVGGNLYIRVKDINYGFYNVYIQLSDKSLYRLGKDRYQSLKYNRERIFNPYKVTLSKYVIPYLTYPGTGLSIYVSHTNDYFHRLLGFRKPPELISISTKRKSVKIVGQLDFAMELDPSYRVKLIVKKRGSSDVYENDCDITSIKMHKLSDDSRELSGLIQFESCLNIDYLFYNGWFSERFVDLRVRVKSIEGRFYERRLGDSKYHLDIDSGDNISTFNYKNVQVYPYLTRSHFRGLSIMYRDRVSADSFYNRAKEQFALLLSKFPWVRQHYKGWVLFEGDSNTAQDNGFYFFNWLQKNHPEVKPKFILSRTSNEYNMVKGENVIPYFSLKHLLFLINGDILVSSQSRFHGYKYRPLRSKFRDVVTSKSNFFLQHGVLGIKKTSAFNKLFFKDAPDSITISNRKEIDIVKSWGFAPKDIALVGLARFDYLYDISGQNNNKKILIMPTWRPWLEGIDKNSFINSDFYRDYRDLLVSLSSNSCCEIVFYVHSKIGEFVECFSDINRINLVPVGEKPVNRLLMEADLLITDYSSVAWDFYKMGKQVVFFCSDYNRYRQYNGFYSDLRSELFGEFFDSSSQVINFINNSDNFRVPIKEEFFEFNDRMACQRTYEFIMDRFFSD